MEGTSAPDTDVQAFYGRTYQTNDGKTSYSAIVKIHTKYSDLMSSNFGFRMISFNKKMEGNELADNLKN